MAGANNNGGGSYFKKYARDNRIQITEETFQSGQVFTRAPLDTGKSRLIINYDFINDGASMTNRKGYRFTEASAFLNTDLYPTNTTNIITTTCRDAVTENNSHYRLNIVDSCPANAVKENDINLYKSYRDMWVTDMDASTTPYFNLLDEYDHAVMHNMYSIPISYVIPLDYSSNVKYEIGETCKYNNAYYKLNAVQTKSFTAADWQIQAVPTVTEYDSSSTYNKGAVVTHMTTLYKCLRNATGTWDKTKWRLYSEPSFTEFDPTKTYKYGDQCQYNGTKYNCIKKTEAHAYTAAEWEAYTAPTFEDYKPAKENGYAVGDYCKYNNTNYVCIEKTSGTWNASCWNVFTEPEFPDYSGTTQYKYGDYCKYSNANKKCKITTTAGAFNSTDWSAYVTPTASPYASATNYKRDDYCYYDEKKYICNTDDTTGTWDSSKWDSYTPLEAEDYKGTEFYSVGDYCKYNNNIYKCITATTMAFDSTKWVSYTFPKSYYHIPNDIKIHDVALESNNMFSEPVGCFAFGTNDYYNFNTDGELIRTRYQVADPTQQIAATFYTEKLEPKEITVSDATTSGFNMLSQTPYIFNDSYTSGKIMLDGIAFYNKNGEFITEPIMNMQYTLRGFYKVQKNNRYKIKWDYRESNTSDWIEVQEDDVTFNADAPVPLKVNSFSCPYSEAIIRMRAFKFEPIASVTSECSVETAYVNTVKDTFVSKLSEAGSYTFTYNGSSWTYDSVAVTLSDYGIAIAIVPSALVSGVTISVTLTYSNDFNETAEKTLSISAELVKSPTSTTSNKELKTYDLTKATGMVYWKNYMWLYGLAQDPTILFRSDINEPTYFPYPNNVDIYDEPILKCVPFNDSMLVVTQSCIYKIVLTEDGGWTRTTLQNSLDFTEFDVRFIQVVKNMIFFKSGDYYYMIVPKTLSLQNELAVAPVSKNIEYFLDEFSSNVTKLFELIYEYTGTLKLINHYNYLNYEDIHNVYTYSTNTVGLYLNLVLLYNTVDRTWRTYTYESQSCYQPLKTDATKQCTLFVPFDSKIKINGTETTRPAIQFLETSKELVKDFYIPNTSVFEYTNNAWKKDNGAIQAGFDAIHKFKNYQVLDSGYRNTDTDHNKRYREVQFKFNNTGMSNIKFATDFIIDGETRINQFSYSVDQIVDPASPSYGYLYVNRTVNENVELPGNTLLGINAFDNASWTLDNSQFPETAYWKARLKVSGKGYTPRFRLITRAEEKYEILGYTWVYRSMYSR